MSYRPKTGKTFQGGLSRLGAVNPAIQKISLRLTSGGKTYFVTWDYSRIGVQKGRYGGGDIIVKFGKPTIIEKALGKPDKRVSFASLPEDVKRRVSIRTENALLYKKEAIEGEKAIKRGAITAKKVTTAITEEIGKVAGAIEKIKGVPTKPKKKK